MKKQLLLGMACMSAIAFGAKIGEAQLQGDAKNGTVIFSTGQSGALPVHGKISSAIPVMKYVIFGTTDGNDMNDTLQLSDYTMSSTKKSAFTGTNQYAKVKKVVGNATENLADAESVVFNLEKRSYADANSTYPLGEETRHYPYSFLAKTQVEEVAKALSDAMGKQYTVSEKAQLVSPGGYIYSPSGTIKVSHTTKGELKFSNGDKYSPEYEMGRPDEFSIIDAQFAQGYDIAGTTVVTVKVTQ